MSQTYYALLTAIGEAKLANATALGTTLQLTQMAVGDGAGATPLPSRDQTALVREKRRAPLNRLSIDPANPSQIIAEQVIPEDIGGWWIRELGLYDNTGSLCAVANCPDTYKPVLAEGSGRTQVIRMVLVVSSTAAVELRIDPSVVLATRAYVDERDALHIAAADPHPQYAPKASPVFTGAPTAPTPASNDNSTRLSTTAFVKAALAALVNSSPTALDTLNELAAALGNDPNFAVTITNALATKINRAGDTVPGIITFAGGAGANEGGEIHIKKPPSGSALAGDVIIDVVGDILRVFEDGGAARGAFLNVTQCAGGVGSALWHSGNFDPAAKANLASPAFSGAPTAPTPAAGDNSARISTTAFVQAAIAALVSSSPAALDTLNELAAALGNDPNFATTITNALAGKAALSGATFAGTVYGPALVAQGSSDGEIGALKSYNGSNTANAYSTIRLGNAAAPDGIIFKNSPSRVADGGVNAMTMRNDAGALRLMSNAAGITIGADGKTSVSGQLSAPNAIISGPPGTAAPVVIQSTTAASAVASGGGTGTLELRAEESAPGSVVIRFHRPGVYGLMAGLDADNAFRIGGFSDGATYRLQLDTAGNATARGGVYALGSDLQVGSAQNAELHVRMINSNTNCYFFLSTDGQQGFFDATRTKVRWFSDAAGNFTVNGSSLNLGGNAVWHAGNLTPSNYLTLSDFARAIAGNGWQKLPGGLIVQWGASTATTVTFPVAFPNVCVHVNFMSTATTDGLGVAAARSVTAAGFSPVVQNNTGNSIAAQGYFWFAIGY